MKSVHIVFRIGFLTIAACALAQAEVELLRVSFGPYAEGPVAGQTIAQEVNVIDGDWISQNAFGDEEPVNLTADVVATEEEKPRNVLEVYRPWSSPGAFTKAVLTEPVVLTQKDGKVYFAFDFCRPTINGTAYVALAQAETLSESFGVYLPAGDEPMEINTGEEAGRFKVDFKVEPETWYRLELEFTPNQTARSGFLTAYISNQEVTRQKIAEEVSYNFRGANSPDALMIFGQGVRPAGYVSRILFNNFVVGNGYEGLPSRETEKIGGVPLVSGESLVHTP